MQRVVAPGDFYEPDPFAPISKAPPPPPPPTSMWEGIGAAFRLMRDDQFGADREAMAESYGPLVKALVASGKPAERYVQVRAAQPINHTTIWADIAEARALDPKAFADVAKDRITFEKEAQRQYRERIARDADTSSRSGLAANLIGGLAGSLTDPLNLGLTILTGGMGAGRSVAQTVLREGMLNAGIEAVQQPLVAVQRAQTGRTLTGMEATANVAIGGIAGGVLGGGIKGLTNLAERSAAARIAREFSDAVPADARTDVEVGALNAVTREAEIDATNPFPPGAGADAHAARMAAEIDAVLRRTADRDLPGSPPPAPVRAMVPPINGDARATFKKWARTRESGGNDAARNSRSSASGRYQFTRDTWLTYHKRVVGGQMTDAARWAQVFDVDLQERLMDSLTADNAAALARIGARETPGNLYLMHFAGQGGAGKVLRAAPDTPIERIWSAEVIAANPFLRGKTADDVVEWAHAKIGGDPNVPVLPRERYASDESWAAAQAEVDAAEAALRAADDDLARVARGDGPGDVPPIERYTAIERDVEPVGTNWEPALPDAPLRVAPIDLYVPPKTLPRRTRPSDVIEFLADRGGIRDDGGHDLANGRGMGRLFVPRSGPLIRPRGMDIDRAGELLWEGGFFVNRPTETDVLDLLDETLNTGRKRYAVQDQADMDARAEAMAQNERFADDVRDDLGDVLDWDGEDADLFDDVVQMVAGGRMPWDAMEAAVEARRLSDLDNGRVTAGDNSYDDAFDDIPGFDGPARGTADGGVAPDAGRSADAGGPAGERGTVDPNDRAAASRAIEADAARLTAFDDPFGPGAQRQTDSLEHDLKMAIDPAIAERQRQEAALRAASPMRATTDQESEIGLALFDAVDQGSFRLSVDGDPVEARALLADLDADEQAVTAARACMVPPATPQ